MKKLLLFVCGSILISFQTFGQATGFLCTNPVAEQVMLGNYNPAAYSATQLLNRPDTISKGILKRVNSDTLKSYILKLAAFRNRNTGSDTLSATRGFGAARNWVYSKFQQYSVANENRLLPTFFSI